MLANKNGRGKRGACAARAVLGLGSQRCGHREGSWSGRLPALKSLRRSSPPAVSELERVPSIPFRVTPPNEKGLCCWLKGQNLLRMITESQLTCVCVQLSLQRRKTVQVFLSVTYSVAITETAQGRRGQSWWLELQAAYHIASESESRVRGGLLVSPRMVSPQLQCVVSPQLT